MSEPKFLVVRLGSLGDIVHAFPAVAALRETFPRGKIVWVTHPRWRNLVAAGGLATDIWEVETRSFSSVRAILGRIRRESFSTAIDYQGLWKSAAIPFLARVDKRIGFGRKSARESGAALLYTERVEATAAHVVERNGELSVPAGATRLVGPFSIAVPEVATAKVQAALTANGIERYVVLSPGGGWISKCWPAERFGELARRLFEEFRLHSVINFGPGEEHLTQRVLAAAGASRPFPYSGSLGELSAVLQGAACVVAGDTGPMHLADALDTRVVAIFGPTDPDRNGPYVGKGAKGKAIVLRAADVESTYKREEAPHPAILKIEVDDVLGALRSLRVIP